MPGIQDVTAAIAQLGAVATLAAGQVRDAVDEINQAANEAARGEDTSAGVTGGGSSSGPTVGASSGGSGSGNAGMTGGGPAATAIVTELMRRARR